jgi:hypothetical protein
MVKLTFPVARAANLLKTGELAPLVEYMTATRDEAMRKLATCNDVNFMFKLQGEIKAINDFLDLVENSTKYMQTTRG